MTSSSTVSSSYIKALEGKKVIDAIFTTYTFDSDFFESEILWILTGNEMGKFSPDDMVRKRELAVYYQKNKLPVTVFFDRQVNNWDAENQEKFQMQMIEYLLVPVHSGNHSFHPKITLLLLEDITTKENSLLYVNGSNNITYSGWWKNVECINMQLISQNEDVSESIIKECRKTINYLEKQRKQFDNTKSTFDLYTNFLDEIKPNTEIKETYYSSLDEKIFFTDFIKNNITIGNYDVLEVITPYFADQANTSINLLEDLSEEINEIKLFLPKDDSGKLLCSKELFSKVDENQKVFWSSFEKEIEDILQIKTVIIDEGEETQNVRNIHAKIFHWHNRTTKKSVYFLGSVNLSHRAFYDNEEAGKLIYEEEGKELLSIKTEEKPEFAEDLDIFDEMQNENEKEDIFLNLSIIYDWQNKVLTTIVRDDKINIDDLVLILNNEKTQLNGELNLEPNNKVESELKSGSFLCIGHKENSKLIFVNQKNFTHKELDIGTLSAKQILEIYTKFGIQNSYNNLIKKVIQEKLKSKGICSDVDISETSSKDTNFFSEYAEIFYSLRNLKNLIKNDEVKQKYFLDEYSKTIDSIPMLVQETYNDKDMDIVTKYITFLYIKQIYNELMNYSKNEEENKPAYVVSYINKLKDDSKTEFKQHEEFIKWFEKAFFIQFAKEENHE